MVRATDVVLLKKAHHLFRDARHVFRKEVQRVLQLHTLFGGLEQGGIQERVFQCEVGQEVYFCRSQFSLCVQFINAKP